MGYALGWLFLSEKRPNFFNKFILFVFVLTQIFDGIFTYFGVKIFGMSIEANPLIVLVMSSFGVGLGLILAKVAGLILGIVLYELDFHNLVLVVTIFYLIFVVMPWAYLFFVVFPTLPG